MEEFRDFFRVKFVGDFIFEIQWFELKKDN